jgi:hypothetical protein
MLKPMVVPDYPEPHVSSDQRGTRTFLMLAHTCIQDGNLKYLLARGATVQNCQPSTKEILTLLEAIEQTTYQGGWIQQTQFCKS